MSTIVCDRRRRRGGTEGVPLLGQEGWTRHQENAAKPPLKARPGWSVRRKRRRAGLTTPSAPLRLLRVFFLMAQPPLLSQAELYSHITPPVFRGRKREAVDPW